MKKRGGVFVSSERLSGSIQEYSVIEEIAEVGFERIASDDWLGRIGKYVWFLLLIISLARELFRSTVCRKHLF